MSAAPRIPELVSAAAAGDARAWESLVVTFAPMVRSIARRHRLSEADQDEVLQSTWLALVEHIGRLRNPAALAGWLATTARNESIRILREGMRMTPAASVQGAEELADDTHAEDLDWAMRREAVRHAIDRAPAPHRPLLTALITEPALTYTEVSAQLQVPIGSIGPTRARCLARLRRDPVVAELMAEFAPPARTTRPARPQLDLT